MPDTPRVSMWRQWAQHHHRVRADVVCPSCHQHDVKGQKPMLDLNLDGTVYCNTCGATFTPKDD